MATHRHMLVCLALACFGVACRETSDARPSLITEPRILAFESEPAEVEPGDRATYRVLAVDADGALVSNGLRAGYCLHDKPLADDRIADDACLDASGVTPIALHETEASGTVPADACARFGPSVPAMARPRDPDASGGYYQPLRVAFDDVVAIGLQRIRCPLANAPLDLARAFGQRYTPNDNPVLTPLIASADDRDVALDRVAPGQELTLRVGWRAESAQHYPTYDPRTVALVEHRESLHLSWFVTAGELAFDRTGRAESDPLLTTENRWRAPDAPGHARLWLVLRDDRGGMTHAGYDIEVR